MMAYVDNEGNQNFDRVQTETPMYTTTLVSDNYHTNMPTCNIFSMEDGIMRMVESFENKN